MKEKEEVRSYKVFVYPALVAAVIFVFLPLLYGFFLSFRDFSLLRSTDSFNGLENYRRVLADKVFGIALLRTILYVGVVVSLNLIIGFAIALLMVQISLVWSKILRVIVMLPMLLIPVTVAMIWRIIMYNPPYEEFNRLFGISGSLLSNPNTALWAVILTDVWGWTPWVFLILLAGLEALPQEPIEASQIDGASFLQRTRYVILPMMRPIIFVVASLKIIDTFRTFVFVWTMTRGGPGGASHILSTYIYEKTFSLLDYGYGSCMAMVMLMVSIVMSTGFLIYVVKTRGREL